MAKVIHVDGTITEITNPSLQDLQGAVGGFIETTLAIDDKILVVNEEGKLQGLPVNPAASQLLKFPLSDVIVGDAVLCTYEELDR